MKSTILLTLVLGLGICAFPAGAGVVTFEGFAPPGGLSNVSPGSPYSEAGLTFTPATGASAVFDAGDTAKFPGDSTSWYGFAADNLITVTGTSPFTLDSILVGPSTIGSGNTTVQFQGDVAGGGTLTASFTGLTTATLETFHWAGLNDFTIVARTDSGIDNVSFSPEPGTAVLLMISAGAMLGWRLRRRRA